mmetsp:Transcript_32972/g.69395  ORF Transcript_32972/g.69395 Transcript_32972/m.69395 type:complete len:145 (+) Transcript_32972:581-1015(+)|eukprot:CAMPEP_0172300616 /NCGR_PEP_ID=MMETSP1058-20130122/2658_1 /TAXON_ID=83371 /ORGANISM="Detonula confervacea, Strain CCMP 353" /LENGTH=144 /DNA_ID=CAMNT_0013010439 /DNA_START=538 /DNA_END=972 /DNA_ORIENTATION=+
MIRRLRKSTITVAATLSDSTVGQVNEKIIKNEKNDGVSPVARPLAVVDYGSIELDVTGSLSLHDYMYKVGANGSRESNDFLIGGRRFSLNDGPKSNANSNTSDKNQTRVDKTTEAESSAISFFNPTSTVANVAEALKLFQVIAS